MNISLVGPSKAGKTSILKFIFEKHDTQKCIMLSSTSKVDHKLVNLGSHISLNIYDFPGDYNFKDPNPPEIHIIDQCAAMVFVLDI